MDRLSVLFAMRRYDEVNENIIWERTMSEDYPREKRRIRN